MAATTITVALDWTPNTNHIGFYVARAKGLYDAVGLNVELKSPADDSYEKTPRKRVEEGLADLGIAPSETVISCNTTEKEIADGEQIVAIAALLQTQTSAIVTLKGSGVSRPKELDGKNYASYQGRFEMDIVRELVRADGGTGDVKEVLPGEHGLGIFKTILERKGEYDATWVFMPWEGVIAEMSGLELNVFALDAIPYGYTPVLIGKLGALKAKGDAIRSFLSATQEGYRLAASSPEEAAQILVASAAHVGVSLTPDMVQLSAQRLQKAFLHPSGRWGLMEGERWQDFVRWLEGKGIVKGRAGGSVGVRPHTELFTNDFLSP